MLVLAQRWTKQNEQSVVEALVVSQDTPRPNAIGNYHIYSAFYDPAAGQTLAEADWHHRGTQGMMPSLALLALDILSKWALPPDEVRSLAEYAGQLTGLVQQVKAAFSANAFP